MEEKKSPEANIENRKFLFIAMGAVFALSLLLVSLEWTQKMQKKDIDVVYKAAPEEEMVAQTRALQATPPPPPPPPQITDQIQLVADNVVVDDPLSFQSDVDQSTTFNNFDASATTGGADEAADQTDEIFVIVEKMPQFPGNIMKWIAQNLKYPVVAAENGIQGRVTIQFVIDKNGKVTDAKVGRGVDPSLDKEALRVVNSMPAWTPGEQRGKPVRVSYSVPISFVLR